MHVLRHQGIQCNALGAHACRESAERLHKCRDAGIALLHGVTVNVQEPLAASTEPPDEQIRLVSGDAGPRCSTGVNRRMRRGL